MNSCRADTTEIQPALRLDFWRRSVRGAGLLSACFSSTRNFVGSIDHKTVGALLIAEFETHTPHRVVSARESLDRCFVNIDLRGPMGLGFMPARPRLAVYDPRRQYMIDVGEPSHVLVIGVPRERLECQLGSLEWHIRDRETFEHLYDDSLVEMLAGCCLPLLHDGDYGEETARNISHSVIDLIVAVLQQGERTASIGDRSYRGRFLQRAKALIESNLADPDLSPRYIAEELGVTVGYLHRVFRAEGSTVMHYVIDRRLERCERELVRSRRPISEIAFQWGFNDVSHFSRRFKSRFNVSPRSYRVSH